MIVPARASIEGVEQFKKEFASFPAVLESEWPCKHFMTMLKARNIPIFDIIVPMQKHYDTYESPDLYKDIDKHWTVEGNKVAADIMYPVIDSFVNVVR